ncbi:MAG: hypothetical protein FJ271_12845 [Planctomycetes bacterium]|nr:hypothetical protein [Planctomycetota bacterium]
MNCMRILSAGLTVTAALTLVSGCTQREIPDNQAGKDSQKRSKGKHAHAHGKGPNGGAVAGWGGGEFHVEFTVSHPDQEATIFVLGSDHKTAAPIKAKDNQLLLTIKEPAFEVVLKAKPQKGDPAGTSSRFAGKHKNLGVEQEFAGTISGAIDGTPYTGDFKEEPETPKK